MTNKTVIQRTRFFSVPEPYLPSPMAYFTIIPKKNISLPDIMTRVKVGILILRHLKLKNNEGVRSDLALNVPSPQNKIFQKENFSALQSEIMTLRAEKGNA